jgi:type I restriction enzyme R subunit
LAKEYFADKEKRKQFFDFYKELQRLYEIISPDQFLHKYIENYKALSSLYLVIKNAFSLKPQISYDFMEKTELLVRDNVETYMKDLNKDVMLNEDVINSIKKSKDKSSAKVINLIIQIINVSSDIEKPHLISIKERAEYILEQYENKQITTEEVIKEIEKLYESYKDEEKEYKEKNMDKETFRVYWMLKNQGLRNAENKAREIKTKIQQYPEYRENKESYRKLKSELYSVLSDLIELDKEGKLDLSKLIDNILSMVER